MSYIDNNKPLVSVCMITYNHENLIKNAIEGILMQKTSFPVELIIGEDCSTDNTRKIVEDYVEKYPEIIFAQYSEKNLGMINNFLNVLQAARGKYIALCEGDDYWIDPYKLQKQVDLLETKETVSLVATNFLILNEENEHKRRVYIPKNITFESLLIKKNVIATLTTCMKSKFVFDYLQEINISNKRWPVGDYPLWLYLSLKGEVGIINDFTAVYLKRNHSQSHYLEIKKQYAFYLQVINIAKYFSEKYGSSATAKRYIIKNKIYTLINYGFSLGSFNVMRKWILYYFYKSKRIPVKGIIKFFLLLFKKPTIAR